MATFNQEDPAKGEKIRRGSHVYVLGEGRHGTYVEKAYLHQEYPKIMDKTPAPARKDFKGKPDADLLFENAMREWDEIQKASTVHNVAQEEAWTAQHANDPVISIADRQYPKTMDRTPAPNPADFSTLEDLREARDKWKAQIAASIVHDKDEEELWLRQHQPKQTKAVAAEKKRKRTRAA